MFLWALLKKFSKNFEKRQIIRDVIDKLNLDKKQEQLYIESLDILDDESLDLFYRKLVALVDILEERDVMLAWRGEVQKIQNIRILEQEQERTDNTGKFNILFDNI